MKFITVSANDSGQRLDKYLAKYFDRAPGSFVFKNLRKENIKLNNKKASPDTRIKTGDEVEFYFSGETIVSLSSYAKTSFRKDSAGDSAKYDVSDPATYDILDLEKYGDIIYEDGNIIVFNKRAGVLSQKSMSKDVSVNEILQRYVLREYFEGGYADKPEAKKNDECTKKLHIGHEQTKNAGRRDIFRPSLCNRLDRNTAGLVIFAKTYRASVLANRLLKERRIRKYYLALVKGEIRESVRLSSWLKKNKKTNTVNLFSQKIEGAFPVEIAIEPLHTFDIQGLISQKITALKVELVTGKTHQIRAQLNEIGHPILGDTKYGDPCEAKRLKQLYEIDHQLLFSWKLVWPQNLPEPLTNLSGMTMSAPLDLPGGIELEM